MTDTKLLNPEEILRVAHADAVRAYRNYDPRLYVISMVLEADGWHVDYDLKNPLLHGGGPHYVICPASGALLSKRYEQ